MTHARLTTYRVTRRCTVRSAPRDGATPIARIGAGRELIGWESTPGWIEWRQGDAVAGYIKAGCVEPLQERTA